MDDLAIGEIPLVPNAVLVLDKLSKHLQLIAYL